MDQPTSRIAIVFRLFVLIFVVTIVVLGLFVSLPVVFLTAVVTTLLYVVVFRGIVNGIMNMMYGDDPDFQQYRRMGGDPYLDSLPNPINPSGHLETFVLPNPEPQYHEFVPPRWWKWQCNSCSARVENANGTCWYCGTSHPDY